jgi:hypothetical protein
MSFPFNFTVHTWVEITDGHTIDRYDFWGYPGLTAKPDRGYIYHNLFPDHLGTTFSPFANPATTQKRQTGTILMSITGDKDSTAYQLYTAIRSHAFNYPLANTYRMVFGPNCNTYTTWLLNLVPAANLKLPWYTWGR